MRWFLLFVLACSTEAPTDEVCASMCQELVQTCEYDAFPSYESCMQGCAYEREAGGRIEPQTQCILMAECDTFEIVDCQHQFGAAEQE
jgi:hypothetical protein